LTPCVGRWRGLRERGENPRNRVANSGEPGWRNQRNAHLSELAGGAWDLAVFGTEDLAQAHAIVERYADQSIGLADASNVILAARYQTRTVVTLDRRHFGVLRPIDGGSFKILP